MKSIQSITESDGYKARFKTPPFRLKGKNEKTPHYNRLKHQAQELYRLNMPKWADEMARLSAAYDWFAQYLINIDKFQVQKSYIEQLLNKRDVKLEKKLGIKIPD